VLTNLAPGTIYNVRIRAVGGSVQYSDWSATMSLMATWPPCHFADGWNRPATGRWFFGRGTKSWRNL